jgi:hypothetical protein
MLSWIIPTCSRFLGGCFWNDDYIRSFTTCSTFGLFRCFGWTFWLLFHDDWSNEINKIHSPSTQSHFALPQCRRKPTVFHRAKTYNNFIRRHIYLLVELGTLTKVNMP